jgi:hypothetical protein
MRYLLQCVLAVVIIVGSLMLSGCTGCPSPGGGGGGSVCNQTSGTAFISLARQPGSSLIYNVTAADPLALCQIKQAKVDGVSNDSGHNFSLGSVTK